MGRYVYGLILVGVSAAVVELLAVGGDASRMKGHLRLVAGLCILVACLQPMREGIAYLTSLAEGELPLTLPHKDVEEENYQEMFDGYLGDTGSREVKVWVETTLTDVFGISEEHSTVEVSMTVADGVPCPAEVYIALSGKAILKNPHRIEEYISSRLACPCYVSVS